MTKYLYLIIILVLLSISTTATVKAAGQSGAKTSVAVNIPSRVDIRVYGYTAPNAIVQATSIRVFAQVSSDKTGYFIIDPLPVSTQAKEVCLTTIDSEQRYGFPLCVSLPDTNKPTEIGPLLLSPTISLSNGNLIQTQSAQSQASGLTLPNADVEISFFSVNSTPGESFGYHWGVLTARLGKLLIPQVEAKSIPKITTKTDKNGNYSINLPANQPVSFRVFAKAFYENLPTPKSQTLSYNVSSYTNWWLSNILPKLILCLLLLILTIYFIWFEAKTKKLRLLWGEFNERQLKPAVVRMNLTLRRIRYNLRDYWQSRQI